MAKRARKTAKTPTRLANPLRVGEVVLALDASSTRTGWSVGVVGQTDASVMACGAVKRPAGLDGQYGGAAMGLLMEQAVDGVLASLEEQGLPSISRVVAEVPGQIHRGKKGNELDENAIAQGSQARPGILTAAVAAGIQIYAAARRVPTGECHIIEAHKWCSISKHKRIDLFTADVPHRVYDPMTDKGDRDIGDSIALMRWWVRLRRVEALGERGRKP